MRDKHNWAREAVEFPGFFLELEPGLWRPRIGGGKGGGSTSVTTVVSVPPPSEEEKALQKKQVELLEIQVQEARRQSQLLEETFPQTGALLKEQLALTQELAVFQRRSIERQERLEEQLIKTLEVEETPEQKELRTLSEQRALAVLRGEAPPVSPQQEEQINQLFASAETEAKGSLRQFAEELAASRGLKVTDAPIGAEVLRRGESLASSLAGAKAQAKLDVSQSQQVFQENVRQFQEGLRQQAFMNRLAMAGREAPGLGLGAAGAPSLLLNAPRAAESGIAALSGILGGMRQERFQTAGSTQTSTTRGGGGIGFGDIAGPLATLGGAAIMKIPWSSARYKTDIAPFERDEYEAALAKARETPVVRYRYKWEDPRSLPHVGIILEAAPPELSDDGKTVNMLDYAGLNLAALKGLDRKVSRLERAALRV